jgi:hypothetical protein
VRFNLAFKELKYVHFSVYRSRTKTNGTNGIPPWPLDRAADMCGGTAGNNGQVFFSGGSTAYGIR